MLFIKAKDVRFTMCYCPTDDKNPSDIFVLFLYLFLIISQPRVAFYCLLCFAAPSDLLDVTDHLQWVLPPVSLLWKLLFSVQIFEFNLLRYSFSILWFSSTGSRLWMACRWHPVFGKKKKKIKFYFLKKRYLQSESSRPLWWSSTEVGQWTYRAF